MRSLLSFSESLPSWRGQTWLLISLSGNVLFWPLEVLGWSVTQTFSSSVVHTTRSSCLIFAFPASLLYEFNQFNWILIKFKTKQWCCELWLAFWKAGIASPHAPFNVFCANPVLVVDCVRYIRSVSMDLKFFPFLPLSPTTHCPPLSQTSVCLGRPILFSWFWYLFLVVPGVK